MNVFFLDRNPRLAAQYHCDVHVTKMILESAQLLSVAHRILDGEETIRVSLKGRKLKDWVLPDWRQDVLYKTSHYNHPCARWVRESNANYYWLESLLKCLYNEYTLRYNKVHLTQIKLEDALVFSPDNIPKQEFTDPPQAMDLYPQCKVPGDVVQAYRNYYKEIKSELAEWKFTPKPYWYEDQSTKNAA
jgi:hypothetical protein